MTPHLAILLAVALPLAAPGFLWPLGRRLGRRTAWAALPIPVAAFGAMLWLYAGHVVDEGRVVSWPWAPSLGLELSFLIDGWSLFFGLIVSGMGVLVVWYSAFYLDEHYAGHGQFHAYLVFFMGAMLGTVLSDHLLSLFVFWELTGVASFLLIGFLHGDAGSRRGARMALLVTGATGLAALVGIVLLRQIGGTFSLRELMRMTDVAGHPLAGAALLFLLVGAFGKSAQFPLHFWLPNAMAAPAPVSAYLHSATMVKLGVFLVARLFPIFQSHPWWSPVVATVAFVTLATGAVLALLSNELKAILAYSTVSQLGFLIGYYGLGPSRGVEYDQLHLLNHVFYKGSLFMIAGLIYWTTHVTDLREAGGLWRRLPVPGVVTALACAAMLGMPGTTGFLSKELMFKEIFVSPRAHGVLGWLAVSAVILSSLVKVAFSIRIFVGTFLGPEPASVAAHFRAPPRGMLLPPAILAACALVFGIFPGWLEGPLDHLNVPGLHTPSPPELHLWHGVTRELLASVGVVAFGVGLVLVGQRTGWRFAAVPRVLRFDLGFDRALDFVGAAAGRVTVWTGADAPSTWLRITLGFLVLMTALGLLVVVRPLTVLGLLKDGWVDHRWDGARLMVAVLIGAGAIGAAGLRTWPAQLISLSIAGFLTTVYYVLYQAPDLALTQILVETITLVLVAVLLARFRRSAQAGEDRDRRWTVGRVITLALAVGFGATMSAIGLVVTSRPHPDRIGRWFLEASLPWAEGANAVNTLLVDFRGFDTLGEITVLLIAMLGCLGLMYRRRRTRSEFEAGPMGPPGLGVGPASREGDR